ncbi:unnamed protein product [Cylicocyclus nassatus]|uniref:Uncharacterized protein n=1 Tax=Cylicocyclus nassatus TaxID=53992 RepID=A0AA36H1P3_CYLNA|nr:unnamed protein product [Cylicocyclus nassatus]
MDVSRSKQTNLKNYNYKATIHFQIGSDAQRLRTAFLLAEIGVKTIVSTANEHFCSRDCLSKLISGRRFVAGDLSKGYRFQRLPSHL